ncbi:hypothetical protein QP978_08205 [Corynebacterium sp. MSK035]|uniref:Uncharacterized protein n=1 Tax=Corynebacterium amycolatum TaxID=43765 RepID=A0AAW9SUJ7_CORAY|nr:MULTISPECIES: hypothetical protein [Corynebacterium]MCQ9172741.1 hypothetical protein [Corynebacterium amycolatum]MDK7238092.1 hypothetical protein [Corynebacterium amycolatum]MDK8810887.1 hypothetical protein [Corynebacterium sp. MSK035]
MRSMLTSFTWAEVPGVFLAYLLIIAIPTALAWMGAVWLAKKSGERIAFGHTIFVFVAAFLICFCTLAWTLEGEYDYSPWQVFCSGFAMVILTASAMMRVPAPTLNLLPTWWAAVAGYALCWSIIAGTDDTTGLWGVGLIFLLLGLIAGVGAVVWLTLAIRKLLLDSAA